MSMVITADQLAEMARQTYRDSLTTDRPLTAKELGDQYGRSEAWALDLIKQVQADSTPSTVNGHRPALAATTLTTTPEASNHTHLEHTTTGHHEPALEHRRGAWLVSWSAFAAGTAVSIAANVMHAMAVTNSQAAWVGAAFWPIALLLAVEVITRVRWPHGLWYSTARYGGTGLVALVAAIVSYRHMAGLLATWGEDTLNAHIGPLAVDGLMVVAGFALLAMSKHPR
jgi:hypothetical protein